MEHEGDPAFSNRSRKRIEKSYSWLYLVLFIYVDIILNK